MNDMIESSDLHGIDEADLDRLLSLANLDAAACLCEWIGDEEYPATFSHEKVIVSLVHHGVELFLKYAIRLKTGDAPPTHYLRELKDKYEELFPDVAFHFDVSFVTHFLGFEPEQIADRLKFEMRNKSLVDQQLRYHLDRRGKPWVGVPDFTASFDFCEVNEIRNRLYSLSTKIAEECGQHVAPVDASHHCARPLA